ncbi:response regulator [Flavobacterium sp. LC2016-12]|uniref:response regulator n=1 Tax=Flavobacterium sp. LC2016-12 TaxID=2783794 RepID=UPI00188C09D5|nr:response regulator [Flavobacterium sp. LC2016-12]MBF4465140.1 response regulator [Flavobacterium sp. LC2016-12]
MKYKNILQIDDDFDDCEFFQQALEAVSPASYMALHNPIEALQKLVDKEINPDLIFLDINMPLMSGIELLAEIKKREAIKNIPVIIFSTAPVSANLAKLLDAKDYITKPSNFNELKNILREIL